MLEENANGVLQAIQAKAVKAARQRREEALANENRASKHTQVQHTLIRTRRALNYEVYIAIVTGRER